MINSAMIKDLEEYLGKSNKSVQIGGGDGGFGSRLLALALSEDCNPVEGAQIRQWVEYASLYLANTQQQTPATLQQILKELNGALSTRSYLVKNHRTAADCVLFNMLWNIVVGLSMQDKERYVHLSRWFRTLQDDQQLRNSKPLICFSRTLLY